MCVLLFLIEQLPLLVSSIEHDSKQIDRKW